VLIKLLENQGKYREANELRSKRIRVIFFYGLERNMKKLILVVVSLVALVSVTSAEAGGHRGGYHSTSHVNGYYRSNGSYVSPHYRSGRDGYHNNNWSVQGNVNPYTGKPGTKSRW